MPGDEDALHRRQGTVDLAALGLELRLQRAELIGDIDVPRVAEALELLDLALQFLQRLLELEREGHRHGATPTGRTRRPPRRRAPAGRGASRRGVRPEGDGNGTAPGSRCRPTNQYRAAPGRGGPRRPGPPTGRSRGRAPPAAPTGSRLP